MQRVETGDPNVLKWERICKARGTAIGIAVALAGVALIAVGLLYGKGSDLRIAAVALGALSIVSTVLGLTWRTCLIIDRENNTFLYARGILKSQRRTTYDLRQYRRVCVKRVVRESRDGNDEGANWTKTFAFPISLEGGVRPIPLTMVSCDWHDRSEVLRFAQEIASFLGFELVDASSSTDTP